jgi:putative pyruvate formate lyase activating enzyme
MLDGLIDIYMPDVKFWQPQTARRLAAAEDYPERMRDAVMEMHRQVGPLTFGADGLARRGMLVRHLVMPGQLDEATALFEWVARDVSPDTFVNIMGQYRPECRVGERADDGVRFAEINRRPRAAEISAAFAAARRAGLWRFAERL